MNSRFYKKKNNPRNIIAFAIFPFAGIFVGVIIINNGNVLNTAAHTGRSVFHDITIAKNVIENTSKPT